MEVHVALLAWQEGLGNVLCTPRRCNWEQWASPILVLTFTISYYNRLQCGLFPMIPLNFRHGDTQHADDDSLTSNGTLKIQCTHDVLAMVLPTKSTGAREIIWRRDSLQDSTSLCMWSDEEGSRLPTVRFHIWIVPPLANFGAEAMISRLAVYLYWILPE